MPLTQHKTNHRSHKQTENPAEWSSQPGLEEERKADRSTPEIIPAAKQYLIGHDCDQNIEQSESAQRWEQESKIGILRTHSECQLS